MPEKKNDFDTKVINILDHLKPKKTRRTKAEATASISQTAVGAGNIQVAQVRGDLVIKQEASKAHKTKVPLPPDSIGADRHLKQAINNRIRLIKETWAKKSDMQMASIYFYSKFKKHFGIPTKEDFGIIWYWGKDRAQAIIDYLDEIYSGTMPGRLSKAAKKEGYLPTRGHLYRREGELLDHLGWNRSGPEIKQVMKLLFGVTSHSEIDRLQHFDLVDYLEKEVKKWEGS